MAAEVEGLAPNQQAALNTTCPKCKTGTYTMRSGRYGAYVQCNNWACADKVYRPRGKAFGSGGTHAGATPAPASAPAEPAPTLPGIVKVRPLEGKRVPAQWYELVEMIAPYLGVGRGVHRVACWGPPGTGKSSWSAFTWTGVQAERVALTEESCPEDILGHYILKGQDTVFVDGPGTRAWRAGTPLVLDEIDRTSSSIVSLLHALLDDVSIARITLPTGEVITPAPGFIVIGTTNANPESLHDALLDRFEIVLHCPTPTPGALSKMPKELRAAVTSYYRAAKGQAWAAPLSARRGLALSVIWELTGNWELACALVMGASAKEAASIMASHAAPKGA
jgi:hypothetical protein